MATKYQKLPSFSTKILFHMVLTKSNFYAILPQSAQNCYRKQLQLEFLDHRVVTLLRNWLEPLPDGSLPNINIRATILRILTEFPIDLDQYDRRKQLKKSRLGKVIMFLSKSDEETTSNRKLAKDLIDKWVRMKIFLWASSFEAICILIVMFSQPATAKVMEELKLDMLAVNDGVILRSHVARILKKHFQGKAYYVHLPLTRALVP
ncbi:protein IWS1 homolog 1 isoform X2 [Tanacetum coccineum]|uniref:Protein IWS1 homolog 1 isoform X2 n=1 Tax=Tanacetum coccineum TaxID=301880 RepID=A0ABQ5JBN0_9ASTR